MLKAKGHSAKTIAQHQLKPETKAEPNHYAIGQRHKKNRNKGIKNCKNIFSAKNVHSEADILKFTTRIIVQMLNHDLVIIRRHHRSLVTG